MSRYQSQTLEQRIAAALRAGATFTSADFAALIEECEAAIAEADKEDAPIDASLAANRLMTLLPKLHARYEQINEQEQATAWLAKRTAEWWAECKVLERERDALAEELREVYPNAARRMADLFVRIDTNDRALAELNRSRPAGIEQHMLSTELHARKLDNLTLSTPSLVNSVHLFDWVTGRQLWPPPVQSMVAAFAATATTFDRRATADWAQDNERRAAAQRAGQRRMAEYYGRLTQQQEERQNAEAREAFAGGQRKGQGDGK